MLIIFIILSASIILFEGIPLVHKKNYKEFYTLILLIMLALTLWITKSIGMPAPIQILKSLLYPYGKIFFK